MKNITNTSTNAEKVIELWNRLERWMNVRKKGTVDDLVRNPRYAPFQSDALFMRNLRNILIHNGDDCIQIPDEVIPRFDKFVKQVTEESLENYMVPFKKLCLANRAETVRPYLERLARLGYSYLPVIVSYENPICLHVFSAQSLMVYAAEHTFDDSTTFADIDNYMTDQNRPQKPIFYPIKTPIVDIVGIFKPNANFHTDVILVTEDGKPTSPLLGMVTVWDIMKDMHM